ncbi:MAG TPA: SDR family NAD(P)-dependent oxidoreductase [Bryobacteraceae bacterium]|nr:SDR family NAD(P)-dependent oxidoreductase [Bryobacteraceae bacterium]HPT26131.1 SDR family NAD(P)-dependent oxidoreductase [Bryobacteraceae bacterium]
MAGFDLGADRVAVITGAASGIGRALASECAGRGMKVVLADTNTGGLDQAVAELAGQGREGLAMRCDVTIPADLEELAEVTYARYGQVNLLINNAGVAGAVAPCWTISEAGWSSTAAVNLLGPVNALRAFLPRMIEGGHPGWVANVASLSGLLPCAGAAPYGASKAALISLSESLAIELRQCGAPIGVSVACPAAVATPIASSFQTSQDGVRELAESETAAGMDPAEAARLILKGVEAGRFLVFTHACSETLVTERNQRAIAGDAPVSPDWSRIESNR